MSPATLLSLWRDRWHKPHHPEHSVPLVHGKIARWTMDIARSDNWGIPGLTEAAFGLALFILLLAVSTTLTTNSQIVLGWALVAFAVYLRRHRGQVVALAIVAMSVLLGARYFYWRIDATLLDHWSASLVLGLSLILAELLFWLYAALGYTRSLWPVAHETAPLHPDAVQWPTVDIYLVAGNSIEPEIQAFISNFPKLDWPANKYRATLLTTQQSAELEATCQKADIGFQCFPECAANDKASLVNRALFESEAEMLLIANCNAPIPTALLRQTIGWFVEEQNLSIAHTLHCSLAPAPSASATQNFEDGNHSPDWAIARRSALLSIGGLCAEQPDRHTHTAIRLQQSGFFTAYMAMQTGDVSDGSIYRIDEPFKPGSLAMRIKLRELHSALAFYAPVAKSIFFVMPIAVLCFGAVPIATDFVTLQAYWLPQWVLGRLALATALEHHRLRWVDFVQEELSGFAVLLRTTKSFLITYFERLASRVRKKRRQSTRSISIEVPTTTQWGIVATAIFFTTIATVTLVNWQSKGPIPLIELYLAWAIFIALISMATLAVQRERDWIVWTQTSNRNLRTMLALPDSRSVITGITQNFPELPLVLEVNRTSLIGNGQSVHLSIFHRHHEAVFWCQVTQTRGTTLSVTLAPSQLPEYRQLTSMVFSRSPEWPMWLPSSHADRLLPGWLAKLLHRAQDAFYNLTVKSAMPAITQRLRSWLKLGNTKNG